MSLMNPFTSEGYQMILCDPIYLFHIKHRCIMWADPANWTSPGKELKSMREFASHFEVPLQKSCFKADRLKAEWSSLQSTNKFYFPGRYAVSFWTKIFEHRYSCFLLHEPMFIPYYFADVPLSPTFVC